MNKNLRYILLIGAIILLIGGYFVADSILFDGIRARAIKENGIQANYFALDETKNKAAVILIGGGHWGDYWAQEFAKSGFVGLSIPYTRKEGLPDLPEEINLEYFETALNWLKIQPEVDPNKIIVMGASRNAELTLVIASVFPNLVGGAIAYAPSSVSWSNTVLPFNSDEIKSSWKYKGVDIPYIPMDKIKAQGSKKIETLEYWKNGLGKSVFVEQASIKVERINGPILLFSGEDDKVWPSSMMADMIEKRIMENNFKYLFQNIKYSNAGHSISTQPEVESDIRTGQFKIDGKNYEFEYGGTKEGDFKAKQDAKKKVFNFIRSL